MKVELRVTGVEGTKLVAAEGAIVRLGRDPECEVHFDEKTYPKVSGLHAQIEAMGGGFFVRHVSRSNSTLVDGKPVEGIAVVNRGTVIRLGYTGPELGVVKITTATEPVTTTAAAAPAPAANNSSKPVALWAALGATALVVIVLAFVVMRPNSKPTPMQAASMPAEEPTGVETVNVVEKPAPPAIKPAVDPRAIPPERFRDAVVSVGFEIDGVYLIVGSGVLVTSNRVATTAVVAHFIEDAVKEASKNKAFGGKKPSPAVRLPTGLIRIRRLIVDPKFARLREHETLLNNLAVGVLDRASSKSLWRDEDECLAALSARGDAKPTVVGCIGWEGAGDNVVAHERKEWSDVKIVGADTGSAGEFIAFHLDRAFPASAAGAPVHQDGVWKGMLLRHPAPGEPKKRIWKYVPIERFALLLTLGSQEP